MRVRMSAAPLMLPSHLAPRSRYRPGAIYAVPKNVSIFHTGTRPLQGFGLEAPKVLREVVDLAQAHAAIAALQTLYVTCEYAVKNLTPQSATELFLNFTPIGLLIRVAAPSKAFELLSDWKKQTLINVWKVHDMIADLRTRLFDAAKAGKLADGTPYTWTKWRAAALNMADALKSQAQYAVEGSVFVVATKTITDMVIRVVEFAADAEKNGGLPVDLPWWVWAGGGLAALGAAAYVVNTFRDLLPEAHRHRVDRAREVFTRSL